MALNSFSSTPAVTGDNIYVTSLLNGDWRWDSSNTQSDVLFV